MRRLTKIGIVAITVPVLIWSVAIYMLYENYRCDYRPKYPNPELYNLDGECKFYILLKKTPHFSAAVVFSSNSLNKNKD